MANPNAALFTPTEAAVLTRLPLKAVNNAIDKKTVAAISGKRGGRVVRLLDIQALMALAMQRRLADRFSPDFRREAFEALAASPGSIVKLEGGLVTLDLREPRRELATSLRDLRRAQQLVISDPEIMGGDPVFRGTRVPVHMIADIIAQGETDENLRACYPRLTPEMFRLAPIYAAAYPLKGRPRKQFWHDRQPVRVSRWPLAPTDIE